MKKKQMPFWKYRPYSVVHLPDRTWPDRVMERAPVWCSVDLRDGNQALSAPMGIREKTEMFELLTGIGFKEIEVGFPSASRIEFDFVRKLIDEERIPEDVTIQVITQARADLIQKTFESLSGVRKAIVHLYNSTSAVQRRVVFGKSQRGIIKIATDAAKVMVELQKGSGNPGIRFQYSPESFPGTELDFALDICHAVLDVWKPTVKNKVILNLPETVEMGAPNIYADRIEWFLRHLKDRRSVIVSVHTHNDRASGVAAAEFAVMAGADRVEGALFGNGERTGNMDIITMALNLFSQGVDPKLDFSDMKHIREVYTRSTGMNIYSRHPYAGELVFTAFSGSHQDAIRKGIKAQEMSRSAVWDVPYLPIDPKDVGQSYGAIIRINSQSGKGGVAHLMECDWGIVIPKEMQRDFSKAIQLRAEQGGAELSSEEVHNCFKKEYLEADGSYALQSCLIRTGISSGKETTVCACVRRRQKTVRVTGTGNGPLDAFLNAVRYQFKMVLDVVMYSEHALSRGSKAQAIAYVGIRQGADRIAFGAGIDVNISTASIRAVISALNRIH